MRKGEWIAFGKTKITTDRNHFNGTLTELKRSNTIFRMLWQEDVDEIEWWNRTNILGRCVFGMLVGRAKSFTRVMDGRIIVLEGYGLEGV